MTGRQAPPRRAVTLDEEQLEDLLERAARKGSETGIRETFTSLGVDISSDPARIRVQEDFAHLRKMRTYSERVANLGLAALISSVIGALFTLIWAGYQFIMRAGSPAPHP